MVVRFCNAWSFQLETWHHAYQAPACVTRAVCFWLSTFLHVGKIPARKLVVATNPETPWSKVMCRRTQLHLFLFESGFKLLAPASHLVSPAAQIRMLTNVGHISHSTVFVEYFAWIRPHVLWVISCVFASVHNFFCLPGECVQQTERCCEPCMHSAENLILPPNKRSEDTLCPVFDKYDQMWGDSVQMPPFPFCHPSVMCQCPGELIGRMSNGGCSWCIDH